MVIEERRIKGRVAAMGHGETPQSLPCIRSLDDFQHRIYNEGIAKSRLFVAFISPNYFASPWCRREWKAWIDTETRRHGGRKLQAPTSKLQSGAPWKGVMQE